jgi:hypothetical protein
MRDNAELERIADKLDEEPDTKGGDFHPETSEVWYDELDRPILVYKGHVTSKQS